MNAISQLAGLLASLSLYAASLPLGLRARIGLIRHMPSGWREHVPASDAPTMRGVLAQWRSGSTWGWFMTLLIPFAVVLITPISLGLEVLFVLAVAVVFAAFAAQDDAEELSRSAAKIGLAAPPRPLTVPWMTTLFLSTLGWVGMAAFLGGLLALAVR